MAAFILIISGIAARLLPHAWNFSALLSVALFSGAVLPRRQAFLLPLVILLITDAVLGWHATMPFTWASMLFIVALGFLLKQRHYPGRVLLSSFAATVIFFVISNFGAWLVYYPKTWAGLLECYTLAIPFFRNTLTSTVIYSLVIFGVYDLLLRRVGTTRYARLFFPEAHKG